MSDLLLIDDDVELCELLTSWLTQEGFQVSACHDGHSARNALAKHSPDAVVLDVMLPDGSGLELLKQLRSDHPELPLLMLSASRILEALLQHPGEPVDKQELAQLALGRKLTLYDRSLDMHVSNLRKKLGPHADGRQRILALRSRG